MNFPSRMLILHGDFASQSRSRLNAETSQQKETIVFDGRQIGLADLKQALESKTLFGGKTLVIIENLFSASESQRKKEIISYLKNANTDDLIVWEAKKIDGRILASFSRHCIEEFKTPAYVFKFLDSFFPGNARNCLVFLRQTLIADAPESVLWRLADYLRTLILLSDVKTKVATQQKMPPWKKSLVLEQVSSFGISRLLEIYQQLMEIEYRQKAGQAILPLTAELELLVAKL